MMNGWRGKKYERVRDASGYSSGSIMRSAYLLQGAGLRAKVMDHNIMHIDRGWRLGARLEKAGKATICGNL